MSIFGAILILTIMLFVSSLADVVVDCGHLVIQNYNSCQIYHDDDVITYIGPAKKIIPEQRFGLITYRCDHEANFLMSNPDCDKCNLQCTEEEPTGQTCQADPTQFWAGLILGVVLYSLIAGFTWKRLWRALDSNRETRDIDTNRRIVKISQTQLSENQNGAHPRY